MTRWGRCLPQWGVSDGLRVGRTRIVLARYDNQYRWLDVHFAEEDDAGTVVSIEEVHFSYERIERLVNAFLLKCDEHQFNCNTLVSEYRLDRAVRFAPVHKKERELNDGSCGGRGDAGPGGQCRRFVRL